MRTVQHVLAIGAVALSLIGCASSDPPTVQVSTDPTATGFTVEDVLNDLDEVGDDRPYKFFRDLDHGYCYTASSRLTLYADESRWAIVMEKTGYNPRADAVTLELNYFGNCLHNLDKVGSEGQFVCNTKWFDLATDIEGIMTGVYLLSPSAVSLRVRDTVLPIEHDVAQYEAMRIPSRDEHAPAGSIHVWNLIRLLSERHTDLFRATGAELRTCLPHDLPQLMHIDRWVHPEARDFGHVEGEKPSGSATFQQIAQILARRDTSVWTEPTSPNNDWRFHPESGTM